MTDQWTPGDEPTPTAPAQFSARTRLRRGEVLRIGVVIGSLVVLVASAAVTFGASPTATSPAGASPTASGAAPGLQQRPGAGGPSFRFGWPGGFGGLFGGPTIRGGIGERFGGIGRSITITKIDGSELSLATADGWTRTIDAAGATIHQGDQTITVADLNVGDQIRFAETRNADGTYKITDIVVVAPTADGTVKSVAGSVLTSIQRDGTAEPITLTSSTTYQLGGQPATVDALTAGAQVHVEGTIASDGKFTATAIRIQPATAAGTVTATSATSITVKDQAGSSTVIDVNASTKYGRRGAAAASLADVKIGSFVVAQGRRNADGSIAASQVVVLPAGPGKGPGHPKGPGGPGPKGSPAPGGSPKAG